MSTKAEVLGKLRMMLSDVFAAKAQGDAYGRIARAHGYVDGFMRALLETGLATKEELLELVAAERERLDGPAFRVTTTVEQAAE